LFTLMGFGFVLLMYDRKRLWVLVIPTVIFGGYVAAMILISGDAFLYDVKKVFGYERGHSDTHGQLFPIESIIFLILLLTLWSYIRPYIHKMELINFISNYRWEIFSLIYITTSLGLLFPVSDMNFFMNIDFFWIGAVGLFFYDNKKLKNAIILFFASYFLFFDITSRMDHIPIPMYPFFALGLSMIFLKIYDTFSRFLAYIIKSGISAKIIVAIFLIYPIGVTISQDISSFILGNNLIKEDLNENYIVTEFINKNSKDSDIIIIPSYISNLVKMKNTYIMQALAFEGIDFAYYSGDISKERFFFNASYRNSKFIIISDYDVDDLINNSKTDFLDELSKWPIAYKTNRYTIYKNPEK